GQFTPMPGAEPVPISGKETLEPLFGSTLMTANVSGEDIPGIGAYEAFGAYGWHPEKECYTSIYVNNMGEMVSTESRWLDGKLVSTHKGMSMGQPVVMRGVIDVNDEGVLTRAYAHSVIGA